MNDIMIQKLVMVFFSAFFAALASATDEIPWFCIFMAVFIFGIAMIIE